ncbi:MAG: ATP-binding cassette domain-containing protein, partial [Candidatus Adiutrix sp.]
VSVLSGGEKARVALAKIMLKAPNLLLLDEPTNHLDILGRQMLEDALSQYSGTLVLISHDRHFINCLCSSIGIISNSRLNVFPGNYDDYQTIWGKDGDNKQAQQKTPRPILDEVQGGKSAPHETANQEKNRKEHRKVEAQARRELLARKRPLTEKIAQTEAKIASINSRKNELEQILANPETYQDSNQAKKLNLEFQAVNSEIWNLEKIWEECMLALEEIQ